MKIRALAVLSVLWIGTSTTPMWAGPAGLQRSLSNEGTTIAARQLELKREQLGGRLPEPPKGPAAVNYMATRSHRANPATADTDHPAASANLDELRQEAVTHSPLIIAARRHWEADTRAPIQESTLPEPQINFQSFSVGDPIPGNNLQRNNFAYFGYGFSQDIPFPGKLRLRAALAEKESESAHEAYQAQVLTILEQVSETYFNLFYLTNSLQLLEHTYDEFQQVALVTRAQYQIGMGQQQDVLKAQLETTAILIEQQTTRENLAQTQADLKAILGREQDSPDIGVSEVKPSAFTLDDSRLRQLALSSSPVLKQAEAQEARSDQSLKLAREDYIPDLTIDYMYQKTGARFPDYYMATVGLKIPLYFWRKQTPAVDQAALERDSSRAQTYAARLSVTSQLENQKIAIQSIDRILNIYRDGLIPQAQATLKSAVATYRVGKADFQTLLSAEVDLLRLRQQYYRAVADHEIAVAKIQQIVGKLR
jgi:cobalt-zinc-cadmium efflux system outer membrane protein